MKQQAPTLSIVIPSYNEESNIAPFYKILTKELSKDKKLNFEILYVNDGSRDGTVAEIKKLAKSDDRVRLLNFSRNFGKELATTAGIHHAKGDAIIMIDADGQHPAELIHEFLKKWRAGAKVVIGVRKKNQKEGFVKRYGSKLFYKLFNSTTGMKLMPGATDFTLIDRVVQQEFKRLRERNRITRGLIDWIGFKKDTIEFEANARMAGEAGYKFSKLVGLAMNSFVAMSLAPLYFSGYAGLVITPLAFITGLFVIIEQLILGDPIGLKITGTAMLGILLVFLVGLLLMSQGITALYVSHIHTESQDRPLYIVDEEESVRL